MLELERVLSCDTDPGVTGGRGPMVSGRAGKEVLEDDQLEAGRGRVWVPW
jgi:hypothetical protein